MSWVLISGFILVLVVLLAVSALFIQKKRLEGKYFVQNWMGLGVGMGLALGLPIGLALDNLAFGPGIGLVIGAGIGSALQAKYGKKRIKLTKSLRQQIWFLTVALTITLVIGVVAFAIFAYSN